MQDLHQWECENEKAATEDRVAANGSTQSNVAQGPMQLTAAALATGQFWFQMPGGMSRPRA